MRICTLRGAAMGALSGAVFGAIGAQIKAEGNWSTGKQIFVHGTAGGVMSTVQGGKFGHRFITAGIMKGVGKIQTGSNLGRTMIQSLVGGTLSKLTGGKFANGAVTSAIQYVVNEIGELMSTQKGDSVTQSVDNTSVMQYLAECAADQFGIQTIAGASLTAAGSEVITKPFQMGDKASKGTSPASKYLSKKFPHRLKRQIPTPRIGHLRSATPVVGRALGRFVPVVGQGLLIYDGVNIGACTINCAVQ